MDPFLIRFAAGNSKRVGLSSPLIISTFFITTLQGLFLQLSSILLEAGLPLRNLGYVRSSPLFIIPFCVQYHWLVPTYLFTRYEG